MKISNKIKIIFLIASVMVTSFFALLLHTEHTQRQKEIRKRYRQSSLYIQRHIAQNSHSNRKELLNDSNLKLFIEESDFKIIKSRKKMREILKNAQTIVGRNYPKFKMKMIEYKGEPYLLAKNKKTKILLKDNRSISYKMPILIAYLASLSFLVSLYFWLIRSLYPLNDLENKIAKVKDGDLSVSLKSDKNDEIARVSNAFDEALRKIESLINSRQLFLRSIMHELKTPIAKGKLLNEFMSDDKYKLSYDAVFERLDLLIDEFAHIEKMLSSSCELKINSYHIRDIVEQAIETMILDEDEIREKILQVYNFDLMFDTDFNLLSLAIKNLLDNGLKYSSDTKVSIFVNEDAIVVKNFAPQFTTDIGQYSRPFYNKSHGLGLGLYIVQNTIAVLGLDLTYQYKNGQNIFVIKCFN